MKYADLIHKLGRQGFFDLAAVVQLTGERRDSILIQLSRWCRSGKLIPLRRGMYAFPKAGTAVSINPALLANRLYSPSYLSTHWALGYYGLIPERVVTCTSVTRRATRTFDNALGSFRYQHVKGEAFFGYRMRVIGGDEILIADPEKALLDLWHLGRGGWNHDRMAEMRFQNTDSVDRKTLVNYAKRYNSPRLLKAARVWISMDAGEEGGREL